MPEEARTSSVRLAAVGDLMPASPGRDIRAALAGVTPLFAGCDVVFANLECTLPGDGATVSAEPRVVSTPEQVAAVAAAGVNLVTLANNHTFDCLQAGFHHVRTVLDEAGVAWFGAGDDLDEAEAPAIVERNGVRLAFLAAVDERSGPYRFAAPGAFGVAPLDVERLARRVATLRGEVDCVLVSLHWGEERFCVPSPLQVSHARAVAEAGASMVLGHHPHVIQGMEVYRRVPIIYSLGNFVVSELHFSDGDVLRWNRLERTGCVLLAELGRDGVRDVRQVATYDSGGRVEPDRSGLGRRRIDRANRALRRGVTWRRYRREHLWVKTVRPTLEHLRWSRLRRLRPRMVTRFLSGLVRSGRAR